MGKQHEIEYARRMNHAHAAGKPFTDADCGRNLVRIGTLLMLLPPPPARVLDLGCGTGWTSLFFARAGYEVVGVDIAPEMIRLADEQRQSVGLSNLSFQVSDYESLSYKSEFDAAVFFDSLHHAEDERLAVARAFDALKPGGLLLAEEPGSGHADSEVARGAVAEYGVTEKDMPPDRVIAIGREAGFSEFRVLPHPDELCKRLYGGRATVADPFAEVESALDTGKSRGFVGRLWWRLRLAFSPSQSWRRDLDYILCHVRWSGLVLMRKGEAVPARAACGVAVLKTGSR